MKNLKGYMGFILSTSYRVVMPAFYHVPRQYCKRYTSFSSCPTPFVNKLKLSNIGSSGTRYLSTMNATSASEALDCDSKEQRIKRFSTPYHSPVMLKECIDALLKRSHNNSVKKNKYKKKSENKDEGNDYGDSAVDSCKRPSIFIDGTLGGGGHSHYLLQNLSAGDIVIGCDVDPSAIATASLRLNNYIIDSEKKVETWNKPIFIPVKSNFCDLEHIVKSLEHPITGSLLISNEPTDSLQNENKRLSGGVDGILLDLGVSSHQIDNANRGFAFMKDGPLDMRMSNGDWKNYGDGNEKLNRDLKPNQIGDRARAHDNSSRGLTAADICNEFAEDELIRILKHHGDEPRARKIAKSIVTTRPLKTTGDLVNAVAAVTPQFAKKGRRLGRTATLARVFQSLRIVVNEEDIALARALDTMAPALVRPGGRLVTLSYHSHEDRVVKRVMRGDNHHGQKYSIQRDIYGNEISDGLHGRPWKPLGKKETATEKEIEINSRARSVGLRVAQRL